MDYLLQIISSSNIQIKEFVDYQYILGDVAIFTIKTKKTPNEIFKKLNSSLLFFSDENTNKFVFNGIKKI